MLLDNANRSQNKQLKKKLSYFVMHPKVTVHVGDVIVVRFIFVTAKIIVKLHF